MLRKTSFLDIHSHLLPSVDHGSQSLEDSLALIRQAKEAGIDTIIATPHFYSDTDSVADFVKRREVAYVALMTEIMTQNLGIKLIKGAEVSLNPDTLNLPDLERLCVGDSRYILIELPYTYWGDWIYDALYRIRAVRGLTPIIAHIDRYPADYTKKIMEADLPIQVNADSMMNKAICKEYKDFINNGTVCFLGSDAHDADDRNYFCFKKAMKNICAYRKSFNEDAKELLSI